MDKVKDALRSIGRFIGLVLLIDLGIFVVVTISCQIGTRCTGTAWSERMFWAGIIAIITAMPAVLAGLNTSRGYFENPLTAGMDLQVAGTIIKDGRKGLDKRTAYAFKAGAVGAGAIAISALIDILTR
ncbi:MAG TPA: hypothetical protein PLJ78_10880 [Anaerolineae bacterium]|nr:hypothetical protein [Anaerolineae bacterium]HQK14431.1 hypothetical protein [Anaerolineae bacterium]